MPQVATGHQPPTPHCVNDLRISQVYGGGGNTGATYTNDFIEIFNDRRFHDQPDRLVGAVCLGTGTNLAR